MQVGVLGVNHKSAPLQLREQVAQACACCKEIDKVVLSTCNRTEIYFSSDNLAEMQCHVFADLKKRIQHSSEHAFYSFFGVECFYHLACVTAGIDSKLLAESDIQRQVKTSYETSRKKGLLSPALHYLFQKSLKLAKDARSRFSLFQSTFQLEGMIYQIVSRLLITDPSLLFIGNSDINRKIIHYFFRRKKGRMTLISRDLRTAHPFALDYGITLKGRSELQEATNYDVIISATTTDSYLMTSLSCHRKTRLILDLSVPRSIHPDLALDPTLTLLNMEQMGELCTEADAMRHSEVKQVKHFLESAVHEYGKRYIQKRMYSGYRC